MLGNIGLMEILILLIPLIIVILLIKNRKKGGVPDMKNGSVVSGILWMFFISLLLFWIPFIGSLIAGFVGGKKSGSLENALIAVFLPAILFGILLFALASSLTGLPLIGAIAGGSGLILALVGIRPLLIGAILGGVTAK